MSSTILWITKVDSPPLRHQQHMLRSIQSTKDMHCHICSDEQQAMTMIEQLKPTVILLTMQGTRSLDLLRTYKTHALSSFIPVIMLGINEPKPIHDYAFSRGCSDYIESTVGMQELLARIRLQSTAYIQNLQYIDVKNVGAK